LDNYLEAVKYYDYALDNYSKTVEYYGHNLKLKYDDKETKANRDFVLEKIKELEEKQNKDSESSLE
jgi:hypothetical protein